MKRFVSWENKDITCHYSAVVRRSNVDAIRIKQLESGFIPRTKKVKWGSKFDEKVWENVRIRSISYSRKIWIPSIRLQYKMMRIKLVNRLTEKTGSVQIIEKNIQIQCD